MSPLSNDNNLHEINKSANHKKHKPKIIDKQFTLDDDFEKKIKDKELFLKELNEFMKTRGLQTQAKKVKKGSKINFNYFLCPVSKPQLGYFYMMS